MKMSKDLNQCQFIGRLGQDIELKYGPSGGAIANFSIACGDDYKNKEGQKVEQTNWINIVIFGKLAEIAGQYLTKGSQVYISGKQVTRKWQDQSGNDRYSTEIVIDGFQGSMQMLGSKGDNAAGGAPQQRPQQERKQLPPKVNPSDNFDDEVPDWAR